MCERCMQDWLNGNILMDMAGHISHFNLGLILGTPSGGLKFEAAPLELTQWNMRCRTGITATS